MSRPGNRASPLAVAIVLGLSACADPLPPRMPVPRATARADVGPGQGGRAWFHRAEQGVHAFRLPYEWFSALERPDASGGEAGLFGDMAYLDRFGFLPSPSGLPLGFVHLGEFRLGEFRERDGARADAYPVTGKPPTGLGLTCAACHTGRLTYNGAELLIEGVASAARPAAFGNALDLAVLQTKSQPERFDRFAARVLGDIASEDARAHLREQIAAWLSTGERVTPDRASLDRASPGRPAAAVPAQPPAFAVDMAQTDPSAPVRNESAIAPPAILESPWLGWMGESGIAGKLGEAARDVDRPNPATRLAPLGGSEARSRERARRVSARAYPRPDPPLALPPPKWPTALPAIDAERSTKGKTLYAELCLGCHALPLDQTVTGAAPSAAPWNMPGPMRTAGRGGLSSAVVSVPSRSDTAPPRSDAAEIGTDSVRAANPARREVRLPESPDGSVIVYVRAIGAFAGRLFHRLTDGSSPPSPLAEPALRPGRPLPVYRARPLGGVWAGAPYLHNGAVPTLYDLLSPADQRPVAFATGGRDFDPVRVGWRESPASGGAVMDTRASGNGNQGHEFRDGPRGNGVIGRGLSEDERLSLIEYLKTL